MSAETREEAIERWEREGWLDRDCKGCEEFYRPGVMPFDVFAPRHKASLNCESGKYAHCTCDTCF